MLEKVNMDPKSAGDPAAGERSIHSHEAIAIFLSFFRTLSAQSPRPKTKRAD